MEIVSNIESSGIAMVTLSYSVSMGLHANKHVMIRDDKDMWFFLEYSRAVIAKRVKPIYASVLDHPTNMNQPPTML